MWIKCIATGSLTRLGCKSLRLRFQHCGFLILKALGFGWCKAEPRCYVAGVPEHVGPKSDQRQIFRLAFQHDIEFQPRRHAHETRELERIAEVGMPRPDRSGIDLLRLPRFSVPANEFSEFRSRRREMDLWPN